MMAVCDEMVQAASDGGIETPAR
ncbi:hypothetical protein A2U01_0114627, partial [Trifolium medium]|nr:hypothetical protein [Trifolium medium]